MKKKVDICPQGKPITAMNIMIRSDITGAMVDVKDIREIILQKGRVREIFPDGSKIDLNLSNYANMNLYEEVKAQRVAKETEKRELELQIQKEKEEIARKNAAREEAIRNAKNAAAAKTIAKANNVQQNQHVNTNLKNNVDDVRAKIEANKAKTPVVNNQEDKHE